MDNYVSSLRERKYLDSPQTAPPKIAPFLRKYHPSVEALQADRTVCLHSA